MNKFNYVWLSVLLVLGAHSVLCKPVATEQEDDITLDTHENSTTVNNEASHMQNETQPNEDSKSVPPKRNLNFDDLERILEENVFRYPELEDNYFDSDEFVERKSSLLGNEAKNEQLCEVLCGVCGGSEQVFDIAEPSCFCKVTSINSVKCLEDNITDDVYMKVIAYVETNPKTVEEKKVAKYLKERGELSLNRHRRQPQDDRDKRCCGRLGESNPASRTRTSKTDRLHEDIIEEYPPENVRRSPKLGSQRDINSSRQNNRKIQNSRQNKKQIQYEQEEEEEDSNCREKKDETSEEDDEILGARMITAGPQIENLWRKALRAEDTSPERSEEETEENVAKQNIKTRQQFVTPRIYKYVPPSDWKSRVDQKNNLGVVISDDGYIRYLNPEQNYRSSRPKSSKFEDEEEDLAIDESSQKIIKTSLAKSRKAFKTNEHFSAEDNFPKAKSGKTKQKEVFENTETIKPKNKQYKSLDDLIYEQEIKRQKMLSSLREKYSKIPELIKVNEAKSEVKEDDGVTKSMTQRKKYSDNNTGILSSKNMGKSEVSDKQIPKKTNEEENTKSRKSQKRINSNSSEEGKLAHENGQNKVKSSFLEEIKSKVSTKPIVSPYIDDKVNKGYEKSNNSPKLFRTTPSNREYVEKDNELSTNGKNKETLGSLIAKIRAKYEKTERENVKAKEKSKLGQKNEDPVQDKTILSSSLHKPSTSRSNSSPCEDIEERDQFFDVQKTTPKHAITKKIDQFETENDKKSRASTIPKNNFLSIKPLKTADDDEDFNKENYQNPSKYLKSKYSGVKPSLIKDEKEPIQKTGSKKEIKRTKIIDPEPPFEKKYTQKILPKTKITHDDKMKPDTILGKERTNKEHELISTKKNINEKVFPDESTVGRKKKLDMTLKELETKNKQKNLEASKIPTNDPFKSTLVEQRQVLGERLKEVLKKSKPDSKVEESRAKENPKRENVNTLKDRVEQKIHQTLGAPRVQSPKSKNTDPEIKLPKKLSLKEQMEQRKLSKLESKQIKSDESDLLENSRLTSAPPKLSLRELKEQKKGGRLLGRSKTENNADLIGESSNYEEVPFVGAPLQDKDDILQAFLDQNPQKLCEQCMEYIKYMSQQQRDQILGQKPYNTRSISSATGQRVDTVETEGEIAQEKFLNCKCFEQSKGADSGSVLGQANPIQTEQILGQTFHLEDVTNALDKIKTGIETGVKGANDKISKGFSDLKTNIQNEYQQDSHSQLAKNLKESTDKMYQKVTEEISDIGHGVQNIKDSVTHKGKDENSKDVQSTVEPNLTNQKVQTQSQNSKNA